MILTSSRTDEHRHEFSIPQSVLTPRPPKEGIVARTSEFALHTHLLTVTQDDLRRAAAGETVFVTTAETTDHSHTFTIEKV